MPTPLPLLILDLVPQNLQFCPALLISIFGYLDGTIVPGQHIPRMIRKIPHRSQIGKSFFLKHLLKGPDTDVGLNACIRVDQLERLCQLGPTFCAYSSQDSELGPVAKKESDMKEILFRCEVLCCNLFLKLLYIKGKPITYLRVKIHITMIML